MLRRVRSVLVGVLLATLVAVTMPQPVAACSGGIDFDWAVSHAGGIVGGQVVAVRDRPDFTTDVRLAGITVIAGLPPAGADVHATAGLVCDQSADPGERVLVLFDVRGAEPPITLPLFYVVGGPDAVEASLVADALSRLPPQPAATASHAPSTDPQASTGIPQPGVIAIVIAALLAFLLVAHRLRRGSTQVEDRP